MTQTAIQEHPTVSPATETTLSNAIRFLAMDAVERASSGHPGMPMGMADAVTVLVSRFLKFSAAHPEWPDRDRLVLSAGHGSMLLYSLLYLTGYPEMEIEDLQAFRQLGSKTAGHPEYGHAPGIETTTGPLGQGLANGVGMALGERMVNARAGDQLCDHFTYVIAGDGCLMEGISHEAISLAGHLKLGRLIVLFDDNGISIDGATSLSVSDDQLARFEASGWHVAGVDGHDGEAVAVAIANARSVSDKPSLIACRTVIGYGAPTKAGTASTHGEPLGADEIAATREALGWAHAPFEVPEEILSEWRAIGARHQESYQAWSEAAAKLSPQALAELSDPITPDVQQKITQAVQQLKAGFVAEAPKLATRVSSKQTLEALVPVVPGLIGGSADLSGSNGTRTGDQSVVAPGDYAGGYIHYGVREHAMGAVMNGLALHGGIVPYGGTFLVFTDYCRPAIRLSALMGLRVIYVMTHDSIGLGEDGPTHQPVEHLASLRAIPNLNVYRPADAVECAECWELALTSPDTPSILALTRQGVPTLRQEAGAENLSARGGYLLQTPDKPRQVTLIATGSELAIAHQAAELLGQEGIAVAIASLPCWERFAAQDQAYREEVLGRAPRIGVEAGVAQGWERWLGTGGRFIGMASFGASAPAPALYEHFGITPQTVAEAAKQAIG